MSYELHFMSYELHFMSYISEKAILLDFFEEYVDIICMIVIIIQFNLIILAQDDASNQAKNDRVAHFAIV